MDTTLGLRIAALRRQKGMKQDTLAGMLEVTPQAVSKWENDQTCPDIGLLPRLAEILGVTVDELLTGKTAPQSTVQLVPEGERKELKDMVLRVIVDSDGGDKVRVNLPMALVQLALEMGMEMPQVKGHEALKNIDLKSVLEQVLEMVRYGMVGNLVEVETADGDLVHIFVE